MGPATGSDGLGPLHLNRNFFYDSRILNIAYWAPFGVPTPAECASGSSSTGGQTDSRTLTTTELAPASSIAAIGSQVSLHIKVHSVDSSNATAPTGLVHLRSGNVIVGTMGLGSSLEPEFDYFLDASFLSLDSNQITGHLRRRHNPSKLNLIPCDRDRRKRHFCHNSWQKPASHYPALQVPKFRSIWP